MKLQLLRNASLVLRANGKTILVDPMLAAKGAYEPIINTADQQRNPVVDLPMDEAGLTKLIAETDAVLLTHLHNDHWDAAARELLPKDITLFCQPANTAEIIASGFGNVQAIEDNILWEGISITRTGGKHGTGEIAKMLGEVSGYVIRFDEEVIYIAGDTIWCDDVQQAIDKHQPNLVVVNGGGARFVSGDAIVMDIEDILTVSRYAPDALVYVVHLEAVNHSQQTRADIRAAATAEGFAEKVFVPADGADLF